MTFDEIANRCPWRDYDSDFSCYTCRAVGGECLYDTCAPLFWAIEKEFLKED